MLLHPPRSTRTDTLCPDTTLCRSHRVLGGRAEAAGRRACPRDPVALCRAHADGLEPRGGEVLEDRAEGDAGPAAAAAQPRGEGAVGVRSEEHTSELQSLMRSSYAVFCLKKKITTTNDTTTQD